MDVLFVTQAFGGSKDIGFMPIVASCLSERGYDVRGLQYEDSAVIETFPVDKQKLEDISTPWWAGKWVLYRRWKPLIREYLKDWSPEVVVVDKNLAPPTTMVAENMNIPSVFVIPGLGFTRFNPYNLDADKTPSLLDLPLSAKIQYPFVRSLFHDHQQSLQTASEVVVISEFLKKTIAATFDREARIVQTPVPLDNLAAGSHNPEHLTLVNPRTELKGAKIFLRLADELDEYSFAVAGEFSSEETAKRARQMENVDHLGWVDDMREVYATTKLVLAPSLVEEGGGPRVVIEGFANGIPAVGTNRGAIPEHIADAGETVADPHNIQQWKSAIETVLDDYQKYSQRASERATDFEVDKQVDRFEEILTGHT